MNTTEKPYRILTLDGGGSKGFYTLGILHELEAALGGRPLCEHFDLIFGTSTGAIIAASLALGKTVDETHKLYVKHVPDIMGCVTSWGRSKALSEAAESVFSDNDGNNYKFNSIKTGLGIVATNWLNDRPLIFKADVAQAHGRKNTFEPGFGCTISDAVQASCSAYPVFRKKKVILKNTESAVLVDGGYCANNPTFYAIADAVKALNKSNDQIRILSLGVGHYKDPTILGSITKLSSLISRAFWKRVLMQVVKTFFLGISLFEKTLALNAASMEQVRKLLYSEISMIRIDEHFTGHKISADLVEQDVDVLSQLYGLGKQSFGDHEKEVLALLLPAENTLANA